MMMFAVALILAANGQEGTAQSDDATVWCGAADADQHRLCKMQHSGTFLGIPVELRFVEYDLMSGRRLETIYAFEKASSTALQRAIRGHLPGAEERLNPWGHAEGTRVWTTRDRRYTLETENGKLTVRVDANS